MSNQAIYEQNQVNDHYTVYRMYCEPTVCERLKALSDKLADKNLMFKFDGTHYAVFVLDSTIGEQVTYYELTLEELEEFAEMA